MLRSKDHTIGVVIFSSTVAINAPASFFTTNRKKVCCCCKKMSPVASNAMDIHGWFKISSLLFLPLLFPSFAMSSSLCDVNTYVALE